MRKRVPIQPLPDVDALIITVRGQKVLLDSDLALLYNVPTFRFNEAVKRNRHRFPSDFRFQLTADEWAAVQAARLSTSTMEPASAANSSQFAMSSLPPMDNETGPPIRSQFVISSRKHRGAAYRPWAFTEHGALMAANILNSPRAVEMSIYVIRAFVKMRTELANHRDLARRLAEIEKTLIGHDAALRDLYHKIRPLLLPGPESKRREIGFHVKPDSEGQTKARSMIKRTSQGGGA